MPIDAGESTISEVQLPEQKVLVFNSKEIRFPSVLSPTTTTTSDVEWKSIIESIKSNKSRIEDLLYSTGAVLLTGFPITTASDFNDVLEALGYEEFPYVGGIASRTRVVGKVFTANEAPPEYSIPFHHELAHLPESPSKLFFFCEIEPKSGGETPIFPSNLLYQMMLEKHPDFINKLEEDGLLYSTLMGSEDDDSSPIGRSWKSTFLTDDKIEATKRAEKMGMKLEWVEGGGVNNIVGPRPAFGIDKSRGNNSKTWFNTLLTIYTWKNSGIRGTSSAVFGDGTPLPSEPLDDCLRMLEEECAAIPWKKGDVLLLDNHAVLHCRRSFEPPRRILASFAK